MFRPFRSVLSACAGALRQLTVCSSPLPSALRRLLDHVPALAELWAHPVAKLVTDFLLDKGFRLTVLVVASLVRARVQAWYARLRHRN
ncbi:hypothetical protein PV963_04965 [Streptomyces coeruleorubidus]|uniref:hypothetical protein n=1 Tax=Streptomyces coeruleorubidus TaxID=116188 RepID=UPI00237F4F41|nr:hypothetical protein [Streptomyces coeruleorubidus]WDV49752.1 hypothetical protein PV963_04965 [Streptomyces coeruleorubidus]